MNDFIGFLEEHDQRNELVKEYRDIRTFQRFLEKNVFGSVRLVPYVVSSDGIRNYGDSEGIDLSDSLLNEVSDSLYKRRCEIEEKLIGTKS